ncbi:MAG TPA: DMT family transporter [Solirubrobacteraceae bacterium]|nr:DMT family transporter [Solirubrobacteraceae bacterium]
MPNFLPSLIAALCWGAMFPISAPALERVDAVNFTALRYAGATLIFVALLAAIEGRRAFSFEGRAKRLFVLGTYGFAGFNLLSFAALEHTSPQHAALIVALTPIITLLMRWQSTGETPARAQLALVVVAFLGVGLVITNGDPGTLIDGGVGIGELMVLGGGIMFIRFTLGAQEFPGWSPLRYTALAVPLGTLSILAVAAAGAAGGWLDIPSGADVGAIAPELAYVILAGAVTGVLAWNAGVAKLGPANAALFMNLVPITAFAVEAIKGTSPHAWEVVGAAITVTALVAANLVARRAAASAAPAHPPQERHDRLEEVVGLGRGGQRVEVAGAGGAIDQR